jgi:hypothetical protein
LKSFTSRPKKKWESHKKRKKWRAANMLARRVEARGQRGYVHQNTMIILNHIEKFRQLKEAIKETGWNAHFRRRQASCVISDSRRPPSPSINSQGSIMSATINIIWYHALHKHH